MLRPLCLAVCLCLVSPLAAQAPAPDASQDKSEVEIRAEAQRALDLYHAGKSLDSLPLYQDLHERRPDNAIYTEGLAMAYVSKSGTETDPDEAVRDRNLARNLLKQILAQGKTSDLTQVMLEKLGPAETGPKPAPALAADDPRGGDFAEAERLFSKGDLAAAVPLYQKTWEKYPQFYSAPLFAGDAEFKLGHYDQAGVWFARAIAKNPDIETAHRYWADCLVKAGKPTEASKQYIEALIGDPYQKAPRLQLRTFLSTIHLQFAPPPITLPPPPTKGKDGAMTITVDPAKANDPIAMAWLGYPMQTVAWRNGKFAKAYPNEKAYRHSLAEESDSLRAMLKVVQSLKIPEEKYDATIRSLFALEQDGMLECWILLDNPDQGTAQDYAAFRATHHDLLRAYIQKYDIHVAPKA
jgi:tetratricopeptide (TPR) repeat protein